jgi:polygalacturonase
VAAGCLAWPARAHAQDRRTVTEPIIPPSCTVLTAALTAIDGNRTIAGADEGRPDTGRIQKALDACPKGQAVELRTAGRRNAFLTGPLDLRPGVTLHVGAGVILFASRNPRDYDRKPGACGIVAESGGGCRALVNGDGTADAAVGGDGTIDGRGWATLTDRKESWWGLAEQARAGGSQNCPRLIVMTRSNNFTLYRVRLKNSPNFHVVFGQASGFTAWGVTIDTPDARNTDGIDPSGATDVTITHCFISTGDDNVAIKGGSAPTAHMTIAHNHFYIGHGMSIGSETNAGVEAVRVTDLSIDGADNGLRIKSNESKGGLVRDVVYSDVCIRNTKNPIVMQTNYQPLGTSRGMLPVYNDIVLRNVRVLSAGKIQLEGYDAAHPLGITFDSVYLDDPANTPILAQFTTVTFGPGAANIRVSGSGVTVSGKPGIGRPNPCTDKFVPLPRATASAVAKAPDSTAGRTR